MNEGPPAHRGAGHFAYSTLKIFMFLSNTNLQAIQVSCPKIRHQSPIGNQCWKKANRQYQQIEIMHVCLACKIRMV